MHNTVVQSGIFFVLNLLPVYSAQVSIACFIAQCSLRFLRSPLCPIHAFVNSDQIIHAQFLRNHIHTQICTFPCVNMYPGFSTLMICIRIKHCQRHKGHHNWRYLIASKFSQQVAPHEFVGNSCINTKFGHQMASHALVGNLATRWRHLH